MTSADDRVTAARSGLGIAAAGLVVTVALVLLLNDLYQRGVFADQQLAVLLGYLAVWLPLVGAVLIFGHTIGARSPLRGLGLVFRPLDLLWGITLGVVARVIASIVEIAGYGRMGTTGAVLDAPSHDLWWVFAVILAPVVVSPFVEELFFRGVVLRSVRTEAAQSGSGPRLAVGVAVAVSALTFALMHVIGTGFSTATVIVGLSTALFGLGAGALTAVTGRLGAAFVAHAVFNALVVLPAAFR